MYDEVIDLKELDRDDFMLTTKDNPFNPFTQYDDWYAFDRDKGYHTPEYQARIAKTSFDLTDAENDRLINQAIEDIIRIDQQYGINIGYMKVYRPKQTHES